MAILELAVATGFRRVIVLDVAAVGVSRGIPTLDLCWEIRERFPALEIVTGGGVRSRGDLEAADRAGADEVLIASAAHDGSLAAADLRATPRAK